MVDLVTAVASNSGATARFKNTRRIFVSPGQFEELATTATWVLQQTTNVPQLFTTDGSTTNILGIPFPGEFSNSKIQDGGTAVDRGIKIVGLELMYTVATSALGAFTCDIFKVAFAAADGAPTATTIVSTDTFLPDGNDGTEVDVHRFSTLVAENDRFFMDGDLVVYAELNMTDGTASDITIHGAIWHVERYEE